MGRLFGLLIFVTFFVLFVLAKTVLTGARAAYKTVFDPHSNDEQVKALFAQVLVAIDLIMRRRTPENLTSCWPR